METEMDVVRGYVDVNVDVAVHFDVEVEVTENENELEAETKVPIHRQQIDLDQDFCCVPDPRIVRITLILFQKVFPLHDYVIVWYRFRVIYSFFLAN